MSQEMPNSFAGSSGVNNFPPILSFFFQRNGSEAVYKVSETKNACVVRLDMPGCPVSDLVCWIEGINVHFFADEPAMPEYNHAGRKYGGTMVFNPETYNVKNAGVKFLNGVLWISVPKIPGRNANIYVIEQTIYKYD